MPTPDARLLAEAKTQLANHDRVGLAEITSFVLAVRDPQRMFTQDEVAALKQVRDEYPLSESAKQAFKNLVPEARAAAKAAAKGESAWLDYHRWLAKQLPEVAALLITQPDEAGVATLETALGQSLPTNVRAWYVAHPGQRIPSTTEADAPTPGYLLGMRFLTPAEALTEREKIAAHVRLNELNDNWRGRVYPDRAIRKLEYSDDWLPLFTDDDGGYIGLDLDPDRFGNFGQVISFGSAEPDRYVYARSLEELWGFLADRIEQGQLDDAVQTDEQTGEKYAEGLYADSHFMSDMQYLLAE